MDGKIFEECIKIGCIIVSLLDCSIVSSAMKQCGNFNYSMLAKLLKIHFSLCILLIILVFVKPTFASSNFTTDYKVVYNISDSGIAKADLFIGLTNKTSEYYASSYEMLIGFDNVNNLTAFDPDGKLNPTLVKTDDGHNIDLVFNKKVTGLGKRLSFNVTFETPDVAKKYGRIWEINIPGIANPEEFNSFTVEVRAPKSFGKPTFIKPAAARSETTNNLQELVFTKEILDQSGVSVSFGESQAYSFNLVYHINNDNLYPIKTEIALPPSTNYQTVYLQSLKPKPSNVKIDPDGNWLATYDLGPAQKVDVVADGKVEIFLEPKQEELKPEDRQKYLEEKPYWQVNAPEIQKLAKELKSPEAIYKFVVKALTYDFSRVTDDKPRLGALNALKKPDSAVCLEYTDLFIALARAAGIPAREVDGYAYTENPRQRPLSLVKDILHAWPEYYDDKKKTWIMVDPTWGSTTGGIDYFSVLDFDHVTFVRKGIDSNYPIPAGGYKYITDKYTKDVTVNFAEKVPARDESFEIKSKLPAYAMTALPIKGEIEIINTSQTMIAPQVLAITSSNMKPQIQTIRTDAIPPFGRAQVYANFDAEQFLVNKTGNYNIAINNNNAEYKIDISPLMIRRWWLFGLGILSAVLILTILLILIKRIFKKNRN